MELWKVGELYTIDFNCAFGCKEHFGMWPWAIFSYQCFMTVTQWCCCKEGKTCETCTSWLNKTDHWSWCCFAHIQKKRFLYYTLHQRVSYIFIPPFPSHIHKDCRSKSNPSIIKLNLSLTFDHFFNVLFAHKQCHQSLRGHTLHTSAAHNTHCIYPYPVSYGYP